MSNRTFTDVQGLNKEIKIIAGKLDISAAGAATKVAGLGWSVVSATTTSLVIQLQDKYVAPLSIVAQSSPTNAVASFNPTTNQITITYSATVSAAQQVSFIALMLNSSVDYV